MMTLVLSLQKSTLQLNRGKENKFKQIRFWHGNFYISFLKRRTKNHPTIRGRNCKVYFNFILRLSRIVQQSSSKKRIEAQKEYMAKYLNELESKYKIKLINCYPALTELRSKY